MGSSGEHQWMIREEPMHLQRGAWELGCWSHVSYNCSRRVFSSERGLRMQVKEQITKLAKKGSTPSQIGVVLRDSHGIAQVRRTACTSSCMRACCAQL